MSDRIATAAGSARVIDPAPAVARQAARVSGEDGRGEVSFVTTGDPAHFAGQLDRLGFDSAGVGSVAL